MRLGKRSEHRRERDGVVKVDVTLEMRSSSFSHLVTVHEISSIASKSCESRHAVIVVPSEAESSSASSRSLRRVRIHPIGPCVKPSVVHRSLTQKLRVILDRNFCERVKNEFL